MAKQKYFWHGEPVKTDFGVAYVKENTEKPLFWYNFECNINVFGNKKYGDKTAMIPVIKITSKDGYSFMIANHYGIGASKLMKGGWPNHSHYSIPDDSKFEGVEDLGILRKIFSIREFDEDGYCEFESKRNKWQNQNFPVEMKKINALREAFKSAKNQRKI